MFAALDANGQLRFAHEVPNGLECGCTCNTCGAPLVAKQGPLLEHHFAHLAGQERVECRVGAANLLRRLVLEELHSQLELPLLPSYSQRVWAGEGPTLAKVEAEWECQFKMVVQWTTNPSIGAPVFVAEMDHGGLADVFLQIGDEPGPTADDVDPGVALISLHLPIPSLSLIGTRAAAVEFVRSMLSAQWHYSPDVHGKVQEAKALAEQRSAQLLAHIHAHARARQIQAGKSWYRRQQQLAQNLAARDLPDDGKFEFPAPAPAPAPAPLPVEPLEHIQDPTVATSWAPDLKRNGSIFCLALKDGTYWVFFRSADDTPWMRPWPVFDGWDECFPPSVGTPDLQREAYRLQSVDGPFIGLRALLKGSRNTSDPSAVPGLFRDLAGPPGPIA
jgi:hypothetical protein